MKEKKMKNVILKDKQWCKVGENLSSTSKQQDVTVIVFIYTYIKLN